MADIRNFSEYKAKAGQGVESGTKPPYDGGMEARVAALEAVVKTLATKEDLARLEIGFHKEINAQTWKLVTFVCGFGTALVAATYFIAKLSH